MQVITPNTILLFVITAVSQIAGVSLLPAPRGFTNLLPGILCLVCFCIGVFLLARLQHGGVSLGMLAPIMAATVPLGAILAGVVFYGEPALMLKLALLVSACMLIGVAGSLS